MLAFFVLAEVQEHEVPRRYQQNSISPSAKMGLLSPWPPLQFLTISYVVAFPHLSISQAMFSSSETLVSLLFRSHWVFSLPTQSSI